MTAANPSTVKLTKADRAAISAFIDHKPHRGGVKLESTGERLDGTWMGGQGIAYWKGDKIHFSDTGSRAGQSIQRILRKETPKFWLSAAAQRGAASNPGVLLSLGTFVAGAAVGAYAASSRRPKGSSKKGPVTASFRGVTYANLVKAFGTPTLTSKSERGAETEAEWLVSAGPGQTVSIFDYKTSPLYYTDDDGKLSPEGRKHAIPVKKNKNWEVQATSELALYQAIDMLEDAGVFLAGGDRTYVKEKAGNPSTSAALKRSLMR